MGHCSCGGAGHDGFSGKPEYVAWHFIDFGNITYTQNAQFLLLLVLTVSLGNAWTGERLCTPKGLQVHLLVHVFLYSMLRMRAFCCGILEEDLLASLSM